MDISKKGLLDFKNLVKESSKDWEKNQERFSKRIPSTETADGTETETATETETEAGISSSTMLLGLSWEGWKLMPFSKIIDGKEFSVVVSVYPGPMFRPKGEILLKNLKERKGPLPQDT